MAGYEDIWEDLELWDQWEEMDDLGGPRVVVRRPRRIVKGKMLVTVSLSP